MPSTRSKVKNDGRDVLSSSAARKDFSAAAISRKPITTLTVFSHEPLLGSFRSSVGNRARKKKGAAKVIEKASPPSTMCHQGRSLVAVPAKPPRKGATQAKLMIVK